MASSSPPVLPISIAQTGPAPASAHQTAPVDSAHRSLAIRRPWSEMVDRSSFSRPGSLCDAAARVRRNLSYFGINYIAFLATTLAVSLLSHPFSLLVLLGLLAAWCFLYLFRPADSPLVILGHQFSDLETLGALVVLTVFVVFLTSLGSLIMSALMVGAASVCVHGAFRAPVDLFLDHQEAGGAASGFLSSLGGAASSAAAPSGPAVAVRV